MLTASQVKKEGLEMRIRYLSYLALAAMAAALIVATNVFSLSGSRRSRSASVS
jgi:hypothetical protein